MVEAFHQRGGGDHLHHDSEDLVTLIDGRRRLLKMPGHLGSTEYRSRQDIVPARMWKIVGG